LIAEAKTFGVETILNEMSMYLRMCAPSAHNVKRPVEDSQCGNILADTSEDVAESSDVMHCICEISVMSEMKFVLISIGPDLGDKVFLFFVSGSQCKICWYYSFIFVTAVSCF
jgi:hypothetical protein